MDADFSWLALEVKDLAAARTFYGDLLGLPVGASSRADEVRFRAGDTLLICRRPTAVPRGGLHTHYAFAAPDAYDEYWDRLSKRFDLVEHTFGSARSLYCYDPDGNCVEIGEARIGDTDDATGFGITGIFEVVLEVASLEPAVRFYEDLGFDASDRGTERRRVRLSGPFDLEVWEPQLGIADGRGGVHVDLGLSVPDPNAAVAPIRDRIRQLEAVDGGIRAVDPDGHSLTFVER